MKEASKNGGNWLNLSSNGEGEPPTPANSPPVIEMSDPPRGTLIIADEVNQIVAGEPQLPASLLKQL